MNLQLRIEVIKEPDVCDGKQGLFAFRPKLGDNLSTADKLRLQVKCGKDHKVATLHFETADDVFLLGRDASNCQLVALYKTSAGPLFSRKHCDFRWNILHQQIEVVDFGSLNGTFLNQQRVQKESLLINDGDILQFGAGASVGNCLPVEGVRVGLLLRVVDKGAIAPTVSVVTKPLSVENENPKDVEPISEIPKKSEGHDRSSPIAKDNTLLPEGTKSVDVGHEKGVRERQSETMDDELNGDNGARLITPQRHHDVEPPDTFNVTDEIQSEAKFDQLEKEEEEQEAVLVKRHDIPVESPPLSLHDSQPMCTSQNPPSSLARLWEEQQRSIQRIYFQRKVASSPEKTPPPAVVKKGKKDPKATVAEFLEALTFQKRQSLSSLDGDGEHNNVQEKQSSTSVTAPRPGASFVYCPDSVDKTINVGNEHIESECAPCSVVQVGSSPKGDAQSAIDEILPAAVLMDSFPKFQVRSDIFRSTASQANELFSNADCVIIAGTQSVRQPEDLDASSTIQRKEIVESRPSGVESQQLKQPVVLSQHSIESMWLVPSEIGEEELEEKANEMESIYMQPPGQSEFESQVTITTSGRGSNLPFPVTTTSNVGKEKGVRFDVPRPASAINKIPVFSSKKAGGKTKTQRLQEAIHAVKTKPTLKKAQQIANNPPEFCGDISSLVMEKSTAENCEGPSHIEASEEYRSTAVERVITPELVDPVLIPLSTFKNLKNHQRLAVRFLWWHLVARPLVEGKTAQRTKQLNNYAKERQSFSSSVKRLVADAKEMSMADLLRQGDNDDFEQLCQFVKVFPKGCILAHAMGLGKTFSTIAFLFTYWSVQQIGKTVSNTTGNAVEEEGEEKLPMNPHPSASSFHVVIIAPKSVLFHWIREIISWVEQCREQPVAIFCLCGESRSSKEELIKEWLETPRSVLIISHHMFARLLTTSVSSPKVGKKRKRNQQSGEEIWIDTRPGGTESADEEGEIVATPAVADGLLRANLLILDEAHKMNSTSCRLSQALGRFDSSVMKLAVTGTPVARNSTNWATQLQVLLHFVQPAVWSTVSMDSDELAAVLHHYIQSCSLAVMAHQLPSVTYHSIICRMSPTQQKLFSEMIIGEGNGSASGAVIPQRKLLPVVANAMAISGHCELVAAQYQRAVSSGKGEQRLQWAKLAATTPSPMHAPVASLEHSWKTSILLQLVKESLCQEQKVVIFSNYTYMLKIIGLYLSQFRMAPNIDFAILDGTVSARDRDILASLFNDDENQLRVLLLSLRAAGVGTSFIGASRVILYDFCWSPLIEAQAIFRVFRVGQAKDVYITKLVSDNEIERAFARSEQNFDDLGKLPNVEISRFDVLHQLQQPTEEEWDFSPSREFEFWEDPERCTDPVIPNVASLCRPYIDSVKEINPYEGL